MEENETNPRRRQRWRNYTETANNPNELLSSPMPAVFDSTSTPKVTTHGCAKYLHVSSTFFKRFFDFFNVSSTFSTFIRLFQLLSSLFNLFQFSTFFPKNSPRLLHGCALTGVIHIRLSTLREVTHSLRVKWSPTIFT